MQIMHNIFGVDVGIVVLSIYIHIYLMQYLNDYAYMHQSNI